MNSSSEIIKIGKVKVRILVPSRRKDGKIINQEMRAEWEAKTRKTLETGGFFGSTPSEVTGSFVHDDGRVTRENITILSSSCGSSILDDASAKNHILDFAKELCKALGQESIFVSWGDLSILVSESFENDSVPVIKFLDLSINEQPKFLTMGWGGIDSPAKILQVLSLDGWVVPPTKLEDFTTDSIKLCAILHEGKKIRSAWHWKSDVDSLKLYLKSDSSNEGINRGDLIFLKTENTFIDFGMAGNKCFIGHRQLRESHSRVNLVTRQLLFRILLREWELLETDLKQAPLNDRFFPTLNKLRENIESCVLKCLSAKSGVKKNKSKFKSENDDVRKSAFRISVLIVGRMMFLRFLSQKGLLPGKVETLIQQFESDKENYYRKYINPLWFSVLNVDIDNRSPEIRQKFCDNYPYLNGGLFEQRPDESLIFLPPDIFDPNKAGSFLQLFRDYEFSLNEDAGSDEGLRIDPSFFGKALENFNSIEDRKKEGVHYTPKPIALALAMEGVIARVEHLTKINRNLIEDVLKGKTKVLTGEQAKKIRRVLSNFRILDPAVGSGVLLWACLEVLLMLDSACDGASGGGDGYQRGSSTWGEKSRHFVCKCLHGVDISEEAVELTRLRLWLAVALSEDSSRPLPDLELNICKGNSLLISPKQEYQGASTQLKMPYDDEVRLENKHQILMKKYFFEVQDEAAEQQELLKEIHNVRRELYEKNPDINIEDLPFNWDTTFSHVFKDGGKNGFDLVIANPPYVRIQQIDKALLKTYKKNYISLTQGNADLYYAFIEIALGKLAAPDQGQIAFIQPNFNHSKAAKTLRSILVGLEQKIPARLRLWADFGDTQVFNTATNYVSMLFAERLASTSPKDFEYSNPLKASWGNLDEPEDISWLRPTSRTRLHNPIVDWLSKDLNGKNDSLGIGSKVTLGDIADIEVGVQTSADKIFLFETILKKTNEVIEVLSKESEKSVKLEAAILRGCCKGSRGSEYLLLFPYDSNGALIPEDTFRKQFPFAWKYLIQNRDTLEGREKGKFKGANWYRFGRQQGFSTCNKPKVLVPSMLQKMQLYIDTNGGLTFTASGKGGGGAWAVIPKEKTKFNLKQIEDILNRPEAWEHIMAVGSYQKGGWRGVDRNVLAGIPVFS